MDLLFVDSDKAPLLGFIAGHFAMPDPEMPKAAFGFPWRPSETLS